MAQHAEHALETMTTLARLSAEHQVVANPALLLAENLGKIVPALAALYAAGARPPHARLPPHGQVFSAIREMPLPEQAHIYIASVLQEPRPGARAATRSGLLTCALVSYAAS
ncbi:hypothetical protein AB0J43_16705 [Nonomuraea fuscirosea]